MAAFDIDAFEQKVERLVDAETTEEIRWALSDDEVAEQNRRRGLREGVQQGVREGMQQMLRTLVERRFGPVSPELLARIDAAEVDQLRRWTDRLFTAASADELLAT